MGLGRPGGGTLSVEDVLGGSRAGVAVAAEVSVICGGSIAISIEPPAARPVSIALASARSMVRPYPGWAWMTRPTHRHRFKSGIHLRASVDTGKRRGEVQDVGCELRVGFQAGCAQAAVVGFGPGTMCPMSVRVMLQDRVCVRESCASPSNGSAHCFQSMTLT